jgi:hypothetical protein
MGRKRRSYSPECLLLARFRDDDEAADKGGLIFDPVTLADRNPA